MSAEAYALARVQEELEAACAARSDMHAEEQYALQRLGDGNMQIRCMEKEVADVRNRLEIADHRIARLRRKLRRRGVLARDCSDWDNFQGVEWKPVYTLPPSTFHQSSSSSSFTTSRDSYTDTTPVLARLEPIAKLDVALWSSATHPVSGFEIPLVSELAKATSPTLAMGDKVNGTFGGTWVRGGMSPRAASEAFHRSV